MLPFVYVENYGLATSSLWLTGITYVSVWTLAVAPSVCVSATVVCPHLYYRRQAFGCASNL